MTFVTAGDPDAATSLAIVKALPAAGADVIELGMPFTDPMADGPSVQAAGLRALAGRADDGEDARAGARFPRGDDATPIILMGYYNPIYIYGVEKFLADAKAAGVDGFIIVDLPAEEDDEMCLPALKAGFNFIRLATPTTRRQAPAGDPEEHLGLRLLRLDHRHHRRGDARSRGRSRQAVARIKRHTQLPVAVGFGVKTAAHARAIAEGADGVVVGSVLVDAVKDSLDARRQGDAATVKAVTDLVAQLAAGVRAREEVSYRGGIWISSASCSLVSCVRGELQLHGVLHDGVEPDDRVRLDRGRREEIVARALRLLDR